MWFTVCYLFSFILKAWQLRKPNLPWGQLVLELPNANVQKAAGWSRACVAWHCADPGQVLLHTLHQEWGWRLGFERNALSLEYPLQRLASAGFVQRVSPGFGPLQGDPTTKRADSPAIIWGIHLWRVWLPHDVCFPLPMAIKNASSWGMLRVSVAGPGNLLGLLRRHQGSLHPTPIIPYRGPVMFSEVSFVSGP